MLARTHATFGIALAMGTSVALAAHFPGWVYPAAGFAALVPDVDHAGAKLRRKMGIFALPLRLVTWGTGHREASHSLWGWASWGLLSAGVLGGLYWLLGLAFPWLLWGAMMAGYFSHVWLDMFNKDGVKWLWPIRLEFYFPPIHKLRVLTGSMWELRVVFPSIILMILALLWLQPREFVATLTDLHGLRDLLLGMIEWTARTAHTFLH